MMKLIFFITLFIGVTAHAVPEEGRVSRFSASLVTWQEPLRLQLASGATDASVANYKGYAFSYEYQKRFKGTWGHGYGLNLSLGSGDASGGGTSTSFTYARGSTAWTIGQAQARWIYRLTDRIDLALSGALVFRSVDWPGTNTTTVTPARSMSGLVMADIDLNLTEHFLFRQSLGVGSLDVGPFFRWGIAYDL